jgi:hypothetical protein
MLLCYYRVTVTRRCVYTHTQCCSGHVHVQIDAFGCMQFVHILRIGIRLGAVSKVQHLQLQIIVP